MTILERLDAEIAELRAELAALRTEQKSKKQKARLTATVEEINGVTVIVGIVEPVT